MKDVPSQKVGARALMRRHYEGVGAPIEVMPWQDRIISYLHRHGNSASRAAFIGMARGRRVKYFVAACLLIFGGAASSYYAGQSNVYACTRGLFAWPARGITS